MEIKMILLTAAALFAVPSAANAATLFVSYVPSNDPAGPFSFILDSNPVPLYSFGVVVGVPIANGTGQYSNSAFAGFATPAFGGAISGYEGPQIFSGPTSAPVFSPGQFIINRFATQFSGTLTITDVAAAVPEAATWAMMLIGFGMIGATTRYRRKGVQVRYA